MCKDKWARKALKEDVLALKVSHSVILQSFIRQLQQSVAPQYTEIVRLNQPLWKYDFRCEGSQRKKSRRILLCPYKKWLNRYPYA